jgi:hypothetical protein
MLASVRTVGIDGIDAYPVEVEADAGRGVPHPRARDSMPYPGHQPASGQRHFDTPSVLVRVSAVEAAVPSLSQVAHEFRIPERLLRQAIPQAGNKTPGTTTPALPGVAPYGARAPRVIRE